MHEKYVLVLASYRFLYPCHKDFGGSTQITEHHYDLINRVQAHNVQHETFTMECSRGKRGHSQKCELQGHCS